MGSDVKHYKIRIMADAIAQLDEIYNYVVVCLQAPIAAKKLNERLRAAIESLRIFPNRGSLVRIQSWYDKGIRFIVTGNYDIYYLVVEEKREIHILAIAYSRRDSGNVLGTVSTIVCEPLFSDCGYH